MLTEYSNKKHVVEKDRAPTVQCGCGEEWKMDVKREAGRIIAGAYYDTQEARISAMNRIRDVVRKRLEDIGFAQPEEKKDGEPSRGAWSDEQLLAKWTEAMDAGKISVDEHDYIISVLTVGRENEKIEARYRGRMLEYVKSEPVYRDFLLRVRGIGPVLAANLIKEFGYCERYDTPSKLWSHTGNSVVSGLAPRRKAGVKASYNPKLRTLTWKVSDCLMKSNKGYYRGVYDSERERLEGRVYAEGDLVRSYGKPYQHEDTKLRKGHAHAMALRKMRKLFLSHYWVASRELIGLPVREPFAERLGHGSIVGWRDAVAQEA